MKKNKARLFGIAAVIAGIAVFFVPEVLAQVNLGLTSEVTEAIGLATTDVRIVVGRIIRNFFGLLGIIAVVLILYGGFLWMTAAGNEETVEKAKKVLTSAVIGLAIMLSAVAITQFVISRLSEATGLGVGPGGGPGGPGGGPGAGLPSDAFFVRSFSPTGDAPIRNVTVRVIVSRNVDSASVPGNLSVVGPGGPVNGTINTSGSVIEFTPSAPCPDPNTDRFCFDADTQFTVTVTSGIRSTDGRSLLCGGLAPQCSANFRTGSLVDVSPPSVVEILSPDPGQSVPADSLVPVQVHAVDDAGISLVEISADGGVAATAVPAGIVSDFTGTEDWDTTDVSTGGHSLSARAADVDTNQTYSSSVPVVVRPAACFNGVLDGDETAVDCGGSCGSCSGGSCTTDGDCASGACREGVCVDIPRIDAVSPGDGAPGTLVSISGDFFGPQGRVVFLGAEGDADDVEASLCAADAWSDTEITVVVPAGAPTGPIMVVSGNGQSDSTDDGRGPNLADFVINAVARPGICRLSPNRGIIGGSVTVSGTNFGDEQGTGNAIFTFSGRDTNAPGIAPESWNPDEIRAVVPTIPVIVETLGRIRIRAGGLDSNSKNFTLLPPEAGTLPNITVIDPAAGPPGQYVTLRGENFGSTAGTVLFQLPDGTTAIGSTDFPAACSLDFWKQDSITVKVPAKYRDGVTSIELASHSVKVQRNDRVESNTLDFTVNSADVSPGICLVDPDNGPEGTRVRLYGERLGSQPGTVRFTQDLLADPLGISWSDSTVTGVRVPAGTVTGPVVALRAGAEASNGLPFAVGVCTTDGDCRAGLNCCGDGSCRPDCAAATPAGGFQYRFSTGIIPIVPQVVEDSTCRGVTQSPSPFRFTTDGCVNIGISARITALMNGPSLEAAVSVRKCNSGGGYDAESCEAEDLPGSKSVSDWSTPAGQVGGSAFFFEPNADLTPSTWYRVTIKGTAPDGSPGGAISSDGLFLDGDRDGDEGGDYVWVFRTRERADICEVDHVEVNPAEWLADEQDEPVVSYRASPTAANCNILTCGRYSWQWESSVPNEAVLGAPGAVACEQDVIPRAETTPGDPAIITATIISENKSDLGELTINFLDPEVVRYWPNCTEACPNAAAGGDFNTAIDPATLNDSTIQVFTCTNESCSSFEELDGLPISVIATTVVVNGRESTRGFTLDADWDTDRYYRVIVRGGEAGIRSTSQAMLTRTNYGDNFSWTFKTKEEAALCDIDRVEIQPRSATVQIYGDVARYQAVPRGVPDSCDPDGQRLMATDFGWEWSALEPPDTNVTVIDPPGGQEGNLDFLPLVIADENGRLTRSGPGCTASCLHTGTSPGVSVCGNTRVERGEDCDDGNTTSFDGCSASCVNEGSSWGAACGDGRVDPGTPGLVGAGGEDCDFGNRCSVSGVACNADGDCGAGAGFCAPNGGRACSTSGAECVTDADCAPRCGADQLCVGTATPCAADTDCVSGGQCNVVGFGGCSDSCVNLGSREGGSVCGNGDIGDGEDCDDGNQSSGDGCSFICTNEGSLPGPRPVCGNGGQPEDGEDCDDGNTVNGDGCSSNCLHEGSTGGAVCGDNIIDPVSEDCDDGNTVNGDGCSARCLAEGSSPRYGFSYASGSYCGNGIPETGEECEYQGPTDGRIDPYAYARANFGGLADVFGATSNLAGSQVQGDADFTFACTCNTDSDCANLAPPGTPVGCGTGSCCYPRPDVEVVTPPDGSNDACRNALISARFTQVMDRGSTTGNVLLAERRADCAPDKVIRGYPELCVSDIEGKTETEDIIDNGVAKSVVTFSLRSPLASGQTYYMVILGDGNVGDATQEGVRSSAGVTMDGSTRWSFTTGDEICTLDLVKASWVGLPEVRESYLFTSAADIAGDSPGELNFDEYADRDKVAYAQAYTVRDNGREEPIGPTGFYNWSWDWGSSDADQKQIVDPQLSADRDQDQFVIRTVDAPQNGSANVTAIATITQNGMGTPCTVENAPAVCGAGRTCAAVEGLGSFCAGESEFDSIVADVLLCENPWPARDPDGSWSPFVDDLTKFSLYYCRDAGEAGITFDDLPEPLNEVRIVQPGGSGILTDILLPMDCASAGAGLCEPGDALGVRVTANPEHLSALRWYSSQGFSGSPSPRDVDGYPGISEGRTVYVNAGNKSGDPLYTNVYLISYNEGASDAMRGIYNQMLGNWKMNWNLLDAGFCRDDIAVSCSSDLDCAGVPSVCLASKEKLRRDVVRLQDFRDIESALETYRTLNQHCSASTDRACFTDANCPTGETCVGEYPGLEAGSFLRGRTNSKWPSWQATLGNALGAAIATDPLNRLAACPAGADADTCWNISAQTFVCPDGSQVYRYDRQGRGYVLGADFEFKLCSNTGMACADDADCDGGTCRVDGWSEIDPADHVEGQITVDNVWNLDDVCTGETFNAGTLCGDGLVGPAEECDGATTRLDPCVMGDGRPGFARVACTNECRFQNVEEVACEAGRCGDGVVQAGAEICDDGNLNGTYGRCNFDCTALGDHCGDGDTEPGVERCDRGGYCARNPEKRCQNDAGCGQDEGQCLGTTIYNSNQIFSCAFDCKNYGPHCGDSIVNGREECDGNTETRACGQLENGRPTFQTRTCKSNCDWLTPAERALGFIDEWGTCAPSGACGDGVVQADAGEACDDGNRTDTDACKNDCTTNVCGDGSIYVGREACDDGADNIRPGDTAALNARRAECTYGSICNYCTTTCATATITAQVCGDGIMNLGYEVCEPCEVDDESCDRATWQKVCRETGSFCSDDDDCPLFQGEAQDCDNPYSAAQPPNGSVCAADCASACPPTYETANLAFREIIGGVPSNRYTDEVLLESEAYTHDLHIPSCRLEKADTVTADIEFREIRPVNVVFVVDRSQSMGTVVSGGQSRLQVAVGAIMQAISDLYNGYYPDLGLLRIGIVSYSSSNNTVKVPAGWYTTGGSGGVDQDWDNTSALIDQGLNIVDSTNVESMQNQAWGIQTTINTDYMAMGIYRAREMLNERPENEVKIMILLSDGESKCGDPDQFPNDDAAPTCYKKTQSEVSNITEKLATAEADLAKTQRIKIYTVFIGTSGTLKSRMKDRSSECEIHGLEWVENSQTYTSQYPLDSTSCNETPKYAYDSSTDIEGMYDAIVNSIIGVDVQIGGSLDPNTGTITGGSITSLVPGVAQTLNLPAGFACGNTRDYPFTIFSGVESEARVSDVKFDFCQP